MGTVLSSQYLQSQVDFYEELKDFKLKPSEESIMLRRDQDEREIVSFFRKRFYDRVSEVQVRSSFRYACAYRYLRMCLNVRHMPPQSFVFV
jgi:hypothetical protein